MSPLRRRIEQGARNALWAVLWHDHRDRHPSCGTEARPAAPRDVKAEARYLTDAYAREGHAASVVDLYHRARAQGATCGPAFYGHVLACAALGDADEGALGQGVTFRALREAYRIHVSRRAVDATCEDCARRARRRRS